MDWPLNAYAGIAFNDRGYDLQSYNAISSLILSRNTAMSFGFICSYSDHMCLSRCIVHKQK